MSDKIRNVSLLVKAPVHNRIKGAASLVGAQVYSFYIAAALEKAEVIFRDKVGVDRKSAE